MSKPKNVRRIMDEAVIREEKTFHTRILRPAESALGNAARWRVESNTDRPVELIDFAAHLIPVRRVEL